MKLTYVIQKYNNKYFVNRFAQNFSDTLEPISENVLKSIITYFCWTTYSEINIRQSYLKKKKLLNMELWFM